MKKKNTNSEIHQLVEVSLLTKFEVQPLEIFKTREKINLEAYYKKKTDKTEKEDLMT